MLTQGLVQIGKKFFVLGKTKLKNVEQDTLLFVLYCPFTDVMCFENLNGHNGDKLYRYPTKVVAKSLKTERFVLHA